MEQFSKEDEIPSNNLIKTLERNMEILKIETHYGKRIGNELEAKLEWFHDVSRGLMAKLESLWHLAETHSPANVDTKQFADRIANLWSCMNKQIYEKYSKIRMASRTMHGIPLSFLLDKIKKETILLKLSLQIHEITYSKEYVLKGYKLITAIETLLMSLEKCDYKLQQYLAISKITPQLMKLEFAVEKYVTNVQLISNSDIKQSYLDVFPLVIKLLTGELLAKEPENPYDILADNLPKKPVFIIKSFKRKMDVSPTSDIMILKNTILTP